MDLIIIGDNGDTFCQELSHIAQRQGLIAPIMDLPAAARLFSVAISEGKATVISDIPIFLRMSAPPPTRSNFDESFLYGECFASLWAAAVMGKSAVINRPTHQNFWGRSSFSAVLTNVRSGIKSDNLEVFASSLPAPPTDTHSHHHWYIQDMATYQVEAFPNIPSGDGPYRGRWSQSQPSYELVVVLGEKTWRYTTVDLSHLQLENLSIAAVKKLDLNFAVVIWDISNDLSQATLIRVDPFPSWEQVQFIGEELLVSLLEILLPSQRLDSEGKSIYR